MNTTNTNAFPLITPPFATFFLFNEDRSAFDERPVSERDWYETDGDGSYPLRVVPLYLDEDEIISTSREAADAFLARCAEDKDTESDMDFLDDEDFLRTFFCSSDWATFTRRQLPHSEGPQGVIADRGSFTEDMAFSSIGSIVHGLTLHRPRVSPLDVLARGRQQLESDRCDAMIDEMSL